MLKIRNAIKEDFEEYFKLEQEFTKYNNKIENNDHLKYSLIKSDLQKNFLKKLKKKNKLFLVLDDGKNLHGFFYGYYHIISSNGYKYNVDKIGYIENLFIIKKYRSKGYASKFKQEFFKWLKEREIKDCCLHVAITNKDALEAYKSWKFKPNEYKMFSKV